MDIRVESGTITQIEADVVIVSVYEDSENQDNETSRIDDALDGIISGLIKKGEIKGKAGQQTIIHTYGKIPASKIAVLGLGKRDNLTAERIRGAFAGVCRSLQQDNVGVAASVVPVSGMLAEGETARAMVEGALLGSYSFRTHLTAEAEHGDLQQLVIVTDDPESVSGLEQGCTEGEILARAAMRARDMVNEPANFMTPSIMAGIAEETAARNGLDVEILEKPQMEELGMGGLLGVAQGSEQPPRFIILRYKGTDSDDIDIALVGKAITFDSGGISIKPSAGMEEMKGDMSGGAAVIAAMGAIGQLKPKLNVVGLVPATENLPSGRALKPGDVISPMGGKTVEIISTDAEGRLALADAIGYARKLGAKRIVDTATLTGAIAAALGDICSGAFSNNQELADTVIAAGEKAGERFWQMPMYEEYKELNKSDVADIKNTGGRYAGSITAAHFLGEFVGDIPWVHLDIAGTFMADKTKNYYVKGATGIPARTLINLVLALAES
ncbi:MAG: leucyl aminopeptidase [Dehalococcoidales bacterium]|nr:leucyl aminopeptidase [Dehalococcoidales bacterium]